MKVHFSNIVWDTEESCDLPSECVLEVDDKCVFGAERSFDNEFDGAEVLCDKYGYCVLSFDYETCNLPPMKSMTIAEFFNVNDIDHIKAYKILGETGAWPPDFIPDNVTFDGCWQYSIAAMMANAWMEYKLALVSIWRTPCQTPGNSFLE